MAYKQRIVWNKQIDDKLLRLIEDGRNAQSIEIKLGISRDSFRKRLKEMGFDGLVDARRVLSEK